MVGERNPESGLMHSSSPEMPRVKRVMPRWMKVAVGLAVIGALLLAPWLFRQASAVLTPYDVVCERKVALESFEGEVRVLKLKRQLTLGEGGKVPWGLKSRLGCYAAYLEIDKLERAQIPDIFHSDQQAFVTDKNIELSLRARAASPAFFTSPVRYLVEVRNGDRHFLFVGSSGWPDAPERAPLSASLMCRDEGTYKMWSDSKHPLLTPILKALDVFEPFDCDSLFRK